MIGVPPEENRLVPSGINPLPWVARMATHKFVLRLRQYSHCRALWRVERNYMVALLQGGDASAHVNDDASAS